MNGRRGYGEERYDAQCSGKAVRVSRECPAQLDIVHEHGLVYFYSCVRRAEAMVEFNCNFSSNQSFYVACTGQPSKQNDETMSQNKCLYEISIRSYCLYLPRNPAAYFLLTHSPARRPILPCYTKIEEAADIACAPNLDISRCILRYCITTIEEKL